MSTQITLLKVAGTLVGILAIYVASIGPAYGYFYYNWVVSNGKPTRPDKSVIYRTLYWPITEAADCNESVRNALESYHGAIC